MRNFFGKFEQTNFCHKEKGVTWDGGISTIFPRKADTTFRLGFDIHVYCLVKLAGIKKKWNSFSTGYSENLAPQLLLAGEQLLLNLKCQKGENILEIGCGDGR